MPHPIFNQLPSNQQDTNESPELEIFSPSPNPQAFYHSFPNLNANIQNSTNSYSQMISQLETTKQENLRLQAENKMLKVINSAQAQINVSISEDNTVKQTELDKLKLLYKQLVTTSAGLLSDNNLLINRLEKHLALQEQNAAQTDVSLKNLRDTALQIPHLLTNIINNTNDLNTHEQSLPQRVQAQTAPTFAGMFQPEKIRLNNLCETSTQAAMRHSNAKGKEKDDSEDEGSKEYEGSKEKRQRTM